MATVVASDASGLANLARVDASNSLLLSNLARIDASNSLLLSNLATVVASDASGLANLARVDAYNAFQIARDASAIAQNSIQIAQDASAIASNAASISQITGAINELKNEQLTTFQTNNLYAYNNIFSSGTIVSNGNLAVNSGISYASSPIGVLAPPNNPYNTNTQTINSIYLVEFSGQNPMVIILPNPQMNNGLYVTFILTAFNGTTSSIQLLVPSGISIDNPYPLAPYFSPYTLYPSTVNQIGVPISIFGNNPPYTGITFNYDGSGSGFQMSVQFYMNGYGIYQI